MMRTFGTIEIPSFVDNTSGNVDWETVSSSGHEWQQFDCFDEDEIEAIGDMYFDVLPKGFLSGKIRALEIGCCCRQRAESDC